MADEHDVIVIGMGPGGEEVAGQVATGGLDVLAIERKLVGGECPYWGCIPSKIMVRAGNSLAEAARALGLAGELSISPDWAPAARRVQEATADWDDEIAVERHESKGETFLRGEARIVGPAAPPGFCGSGPLAPGVIRGIGKDDYVHVIMPVRTAS